MWRWCPCRTRTALISGNGIQFLFPFPEINAVLVLHRHHLHIIPGSFYLLYTYLRKANVFHQTFLLDLLQKFKVFSNGTSGSIRWS